MSETLTATQSETRGDLANWLRQRARDLAPFLTLMVLLIFFSVTTDSFLRLVNLRNILAQVSTLAVVSTGITFVLLCGEIDLSIAAVATMTGVVAAALFGEGLRISESLYIGGGWEFAGGLFAVLVGGVFAAALGLLNGWSTTRIGLPSFMATLAVMQIATGLGQYFTKGQIVYTLAPMLSFLGGEYIGEAEPFRLPVVILVGASALIIGHFVLTYTKFGRYVYMTGSNREAARLSGINTQRIVAACLTISAFSAGVAGMLNTGRLGSAQGYGLEDMLLDSISAVVLGGTSLFGGEGGVKNTLVGLLIFGVLSNGLNQLQLDIYVRLWVRGIILLIALIINIYALRLRDRGAQ
ncbi:MAG: ABC transporter permease [Caldilineaceae bacterium]|nr:ABC transporter permease [Caldilineaceae bacterium]MCB9149362.1 ABC transporter permease [Caldilineaceae bacterium]